MNSREALEFLTEGICNCPQCSKYVECMDLDESESVCENAKFIIKKDLKKLEQLEKENAKLKQEYQELKENYESLRKDYWELDKIEEGILGKFIVQGQVISAIQKEIINKIENETIYEDVIPMCEVTIRINKEIFDLLFESVGGSDEEN